MMLKRFFFNVIFLVIFLFIINLWLLGSFYRVHKKLPSTNSIFSFSHLHVDTNTQQNFHQEHLNADFVNIEDDEIGDSSTVNASVVYITLPSDEAEASTDSANTDRENLIFGSVSTMPYLWGVASGNVLGSSPTMDRMVLLDSWIKYLSSHLKEVKSKTLMIYEGGVERWNGGVKNVKNDTAKFCNTKCKYLVGPYGMNRADGVLFIRDWFYHSDGVKVPENKLKILSFLESPLASRGDFAQPNTVVASYNRGSDIVIPYGKWVTKPQQKNLKKENKNYAAGKTKMAAAFTSNCGASNNRMLLINSLKSYISVDVYGACGNLSCPRSKSEECFEKLKQEYKFYLSFENANCRDYITEKLFMNAYQNDVIPVVFGAHPFDYKAMAPLGSYIHVEDFPSVEDLANHLKVLNENDTLYNQYFKWKNTGEFYSPPQYASTLCRMCAMIHYAHYTNTGPPIRKNNSWSNFDNCLPQGKWYWTRED